VHPGLLFCQGWLSAAQGDTKHGLTLWSQFLAEPAESRSYWAWWPCWMPIMFEVAMVCGARDLTETVVAIAEEGAACNPEVATLKGVAVSLRGLFTNDLAMVAESVEILRHCPRLPIRAWGIENYGLMLLHSGERQAGLDQLDQAWDEYDHMGALGRRAAVQRVMRQAGVRRTKWSNDNSGGASRPLTEAERRVVFVIADGHTDKSAAKLLGISENTVGTHIRSAYRKLGVQSRVQLANALRDLGELD
jgi:DNA-binding CsgD family transcriptional regulator